MVFHLTYLGDELRCLNKCLANCSLYYIIYIYEPMSDAMRSAATYRSVMLYPCV